MMNLKNIQIFLILTTAVSLLVLSFILFPPKRAQAVALRPAPQIIEKILPFGHHKPIKSRSIDTLIIHSSYDALGKNPYNLSGLLKEYKLYGVSPHYLITREGTIYRLAPDKHIAYQAGKSQMPDKRIRVNDFSLGIELMNSKIDKPTEAQYDSLANLVNFLKTKYTLNYILGHNQIAPNRKTDPWNFDWRKFNQLLKEKTNNGNKKADY